MHFDCADYCATYMGGGFVNQDLLRARDRQQAYYESILHGLCCTSSKSNFSNCQVICQRLISLLIRTRVFTRNSICKKIENTTYSEIGFLGIRILLRHFYCKPFLRKSDSLVLYIFSEDHSIRDARRKEVRISKNREKTNERRQARDDFDSCDISDILFFYFG